VVGGEEDGEKESIAPEKLENRCLLDGLESETTNQEINFEVEVTQLGNQWKTFFI
jgi:hypothetical protein